MVDIAYCKIFPSIGVARLGDCDDFYLGPEAPGVAPDPVGGFKDVDGAIKRQGARFRIYGFDAADRVVRELTSAEARITWSVELANTKAEWFKFAGVRAGQALDQHGDPARRRNLAVADRTQLRIAPSPRRITGPDRHGDAYRFDDGLFFGARVYLGELRTDDHGRLIVLGGKGQSGCTAEGEPLSHYANNDYWHDDVADGPVSATVTLAGADVPVRGGAWLLVAPPKFAPTHRNIITLFDVMTEAAGIKPAAQLSFTRDIYPVFERMAGYQWVNAMALRGHGPGRPGNFHDPDIIAKLADNTATGAAYRQGVLARIRNPRQHTAAQANYTLMPILSGDEGDATVGDAETWLYLLESQYATLERWARGEFASDWTEPAPPPALDQLPVAEQPAALTRAALEYCVGGPFFPGIELTYVARYADWYAEPYRFKDGMFHAGDMTKRMAVPWQADFFECQVHWWPAQRPDDVLNEDTFEEALGNGRFQDEARDGRLASALLDRIRWDRGVGDRLRLPPGKDPSRPPLPGDNDMVTAWKTLGFIEPRKTPQGEVLYVETGRSRYDGLRDRDYFFYLLNIDAFPDFLPRAKQLAEQFLRDARRRLDDPDPSALDDMYRDFAYSPALLAQRLDEIYAAYAAEAEQDPLAEPDNPFQTLDDMKERIRQFAPLNQMDGAWIRNVAHAGPIDRVTANLFNIWMDEMGDGNPEQNHANVYTQLLAKVGIQLDPVSSRAYADNPDMLDSAFTVPMFELAISQFTETFFPEVLGMSLQLEWEVLALKPTIKLLSHFGIDPHFYELHVGIDNASNGHGAKARAAVEWYLDAARARGGDEEVQRLWTRIWNGYVAFATTGTLGDDLRDRLKQRATAPASPADRVAAMMQRKKQYGSLNHGDRRLGPNLVNDLFEDPGAFMQGLIDAGYIVPGSIAASSFFGAISFNGPMYKVFDDDEVRLWQEWVESLGHGTGPQPVTDPAALMALCIDTLRARQAGTPGHANTQLVGPDPARPDATITQSIAGWFQAPTRTFMAVLANPANQLIVKGNAGESRFISQLVDNNGRMSAAFGGSGGAATGNKTWRQIAVDWIDAGCPLPPAPRRSHAAIARSPEHVGRATRSRLSLTTPERVIRAHPRGRILGMGAPH